MLGELGLSEAFETLLVSKLWRGLCGRCGAFGDHFPRACPLLQKNSRNGGVERSGRESFKKSVKVSDYDPELEAYLKEHRCLHLLEPMRQYGIIAIDDINENAVNRMLANSDMHLSEQELDVLSDRQVQAFKELVKSNLQQLLEHHTPSPSKGHSEHLCFISHYKLEAGTEASLMQDGLHNFIKEDERSSGHTFERPVFIDTEDLRDLNDLETFVQRSHNLILLLTKNVLTRPWCLLEILFARKHSTTVVPVEIQRRDASFDYPDEAFFASLKDGTLLDFEAEAMLRKEGFSLEDVEKSLRQVFKKIALPFSPHKSTNVREAELRDILKVCHLREGGSPSGDSPRCKRSRSESLCKIISKDTSFQEGAVNTSPYTSFTPSALTPWRPAATSCDIGTLAH
jgi:hypothetical protein